MRRRWLCAFALLLALFLSACSASGSEYYYAERHHNIEQAQGEQQSGIRTYDQLRSAMEDIINLMDTGASLTLFSYEGDLVADLDRLTKYLTESYPLGNFAVTSIVFTPTVIASYCELSIAISYNRTFDEVQSVAQVVSVDELGDCIDEMLSNFRAKRAFSLADLKISDEELWALFEKCWLQSGACAYGIREVEFVFYPKDMANCILEIEMPYLVSELELRNIAADTRRKAASVAAACTEEALFDKLQYAAYYLYDNVVFDSDAGRVVSETHGRQPKTSLYVATGALIDGTASESGLALAASMILDELRIDNTVISGTVDGVPRIWLYVKNGTNGVYFDPIGLYEGKEYLYDLGSKKTSFEYDAEIYK